MEAASSNGVRPPRPQRARGSALLSNRTYEKDVFKNHLSFFVRISDLHRLRLVGHHGEMDQRG